MLLWRAAGVTQAAAGGRRGNSWPGCNTDGARSGAQSVATLDEFPCTQSTEKEAPDAPRSPQSDPFSVSQPDSGVSRTVKSAFKTSKTLPSCSLTVQKWNLLCSSHKDSVLASTICSCQSLEFVFKPGIFVRKPEFSYVLPSTFVWLRRPLLVFQDRQTDRRTDKQTDILALSLFFIQPNRKSSHFHPTLNCPAKGYLVQHPTETKSAVNFVM